MNIIFYDFSFLFFLLDLNIFVFVWFFLSCFVLVFVSFYLVLIVSNFVVWSLKFWDLYNNYLVFHLFGFSVFFFFNFFIWLKFLVCYLDLWVSRLNLLFVGCPSHRRSHPQQMATRGSARPRRKVKFFGVLIYIITIHILYM